MIRRRKICCGTLPKRNGNNLTERTQAELTSYVSYIIDLEHVAESLKAPQFNDGDYAFWDLKEPSSESKDG
jgi:hypothetical protein